MVTDNQVVEERIKKRQKSKNNAENYLKEMPRWIKENQEFNANNKTDVTIHNESFDTDIKVLFKALDKILK